MITYATINRETDLIPTDVPRIQSVSGYGSKLPTGYMVNYKGKKRRVYAICYSNSASHYVLVKGQKEFIK